MAVNQQFRSAQVELPDSLEEINEYFYKQRMTDGLPIIPPTRERVTEMIEASGKDGSEVIGKIAPLWAPATVEKIAINAVMAGCAPEYMPLLFAAVEAMCEPQFNLHGIQTTTNPVSPVFVINGPVRKKLDINCGAGVLGPGWRANATIGRAVRLLLINVGGATPGDVDKATMGWPGKYTCVIGEYEELNPWEPLHVERGFKREESTVTAFGVDGCTPITELTPYPEQVLRLVAHGMVRAPVGFAARPTDPGALHQRILLLNPVFAGMFAKLGHSKQSLKKYLFDTARIPADWIPKSHTWDIPENGKLPMTQGPEGFEVIVTGSESGFQVTSMVTVITRSVTKLVR